MLIPIADVPRWYAERKPKDAVAVSHGADTLTWEQLERSANRRARAFAAKGVKPGDFVAIGLPNSNAFFETTLCGVEMRRDADVADLAAAARRGRRRARHSQTVAGGRRRSRLERAEFAAGRFRAGRLFRRTAEQSGGALLEGDLQRRIHGPAESDRRS